MASVSPKATLTIVMISSTVTSPSPLQSPTHGGGDTTVGVCVGTPLGVALGGGLAVPVETAVAVASGSDVALAVGTLDGVGVDVAGTVAVGVVVGVAVGVAVLVCVAVVVKVNVGREVDVAVAVAVGVGVHSGPSGSAGTCTKVRVPAKFVNIAAPLTRSGETSNPKRQTPLGTNPSVEKATLALPGGATISPVAIRFPERLSVTSTSTATLAVVRLTTTHCNCRSALKTGAL